MWKRTATKALYDTFVLPLRSVGLVHLYLASFMASMGIAFLGVYVAFDLASLGVKPVLSFFLVKFFLGCIVLMPFFLWMMQRGWLKFALALMGVIQIVCLVTLFAINAAAQSVIPMCIITTTTEFVFWSIYNPSMMLLNSDKNRGNELTLGMAGLSAGSLIGALLAGLALISDVSKIIIMGFPCALIFLGTWIVAVKLLWKNRDMLEAASYGSVIKFLTCRPQRRNGTIFLGAFELATFVIAPVWMKVIGISGAVVGSITSLQVFLRIILTPVFGFIVNRRQGEAVQAGSLLKFLGWLPVMAAKSPLAIALIMILTSCGWQLYSTSLTNRWFEERALASISAREICLGFGRLIGASITIPLIYVSFQYFLVAVFIFAAATVFNGFVIRAKDRKKLLEQARACEAGCETPKQ